MRDGAYLVNCSRGELVSTPDILDALQSGKLAGYGADVLDEEPPRKDHPLLRAPNCIITPHIGSRTIESVGRQATKATENMIRMLKGEEPHARAV
jgi:D-3-phosphoglycerate dehydrogenase